METAQAKEDINESMSIECLKTLLVIKAIMALNLILAKRSDKMKLEVVQPVIL